MDPGPSLRAGFSGVQVDAIILQGAPQPLDDEVVEQRSLAVHRDANTYPP